MGAVAHQGRSESRTAAAPGRPRHGGWREPAIAQSWTAARRNRQAEACAGNHVSSRHGVCQRSVASAMSALRILSIAILGRKVD
jgi:hypothetical protein